MGSVVTSGLLLPCLLGTPKAGLSLDLFEVLVWAEA
jgi:hypothetical protein